MWLYGLLSGCSSTDFELDVMNTVLVRKILFMEEPVAEINVVGWFPLLLRCLWRSAMEGIQLVEIPTHISIEYARRTKTTQYV